MCVFCSFRHDVCVCLWMYVYNIFYYLKRVELRKNLLGAFVGLGRGSKYATTGIQGRGSALGPPLTTEASISDATAETKYKKNILIKFYRITYNIFYLRIFSSWWKMQILDLFFCRAHPKFIYFDEKLYVSSEGNVWTGKTFGNFLGNKNVSSNCLNKINEEITTRYFNIWYHYEILMDLNLIIKKMVSLCT